MSRQLALLSTIAKISSGKRPTVVVREKSGECQFPVIGGGGVSGYTDRSCEPQGILITGRVGTLGKLHVSDQACWPSDNALVLKPASEAVDPIFLRYAVSSVVSKAVGLNRGAANPLVTQKDLGNLEVAIFSICEQRGIAAVLGALDDKIELNRRTAATLEEMARALYRSWFVDFHPVWARLEGRPPAHMDPATAALFPAAFDDEGLPVGWRRDPIGQHFTASKGLSYKGEGLCGAEDGVPLHNLNSILEGGGYKHAGIKYYRGDYKQRHLIRRGDLIVANTEQGFDHLLIGHSAIVPEAFGPVGLFSHHTYRVDPNPGAFLTREWLYLALSVSPFGTVVRSYSNGTTVNMLPADAFEIPKIIVPNASVVDVFTSQIRGWFALRDEAQAQARTLADLRDTLLPRLMSGELRVAEAREEVEAVA